MGWKSADGRCPQHTYIFGLFATAIAVSLFMVPGGSVHAQSTVDADTREQIQTIVQDIERAIENGNSAAITTYIPQSQRSFKNAVEDAVAGRTISFTQSIDEYRRTKEGTVIASGSFTAEGGNWKVEAYNSYIFEQQNGEVVLVGGTFHKRLEPGAALTNIISTLSGTIWVVIAAILILIVLGTVFWIWMLIDAARRDLDDKVVWILIILFLNILGALIYFFVGRRQAIKTAQKGDNSQD